MAEAGVTRQCPGTGVRDGVPVLITPDSPGDDSGGCSAAWAGRAPARTSQPHHAPQAVKLCRAVS